MTTRATTKSQTQERSMTQDERGRLTRFLNDYPSQERAAAVVGVPTRTLTRAIAGTVNPSNLLRYRLVALGIWEKRSEP